MNVVRIEPRAGRNLQAGKPWVFSNSVREVEGSPAAGDVVRVKAGPAGADRDLGTAFYNPHSLIALRHVSLEGESPDRAWLSRRLLAARRLRERLFPGSDSYRLCHGESDWLPGLIVDRWGSVASVQVVSAGMERLLGDVTRVLVDDLGFETVVERNESHLRKLEGLDKRAGVLHGEDPGLVIVDQPPLRVPARPLTAQKTGGFLDQRENRAAVARHARGRRVYDGYSHAGLFGVHAALAGALSVVSVDTSEEALELARCAASENGVTDRVEHVQADVGEDMDRRHQQRERFGLVIVDPPSFTRSRKHVPAARRALRQLNRRALTLVEPEGVFVSASCSQHLREETFLEVLAQAARDAQRPLRFLEVRGAAPDHPVPAELPEARYLTCVIAQLD